MNKKTFLRQLNKRFRSLPRQEREDRLRFYGEMIDDRMEEGLTEEEAVAAIGSAEELSADLPRQEKKRRGIWTAILLVLGAPLWIPLLAAAFAVVLALFIVLLAAVISLWAAFAAVAVCVLGGLVIAFSLLFSNPYTGWAVLGAVMVCAGLSIFLFLGCRAVTKGFAWLVKRTVRRKGAAA